ncbi:mannan endo-1,4-beta-mannosidase 4-like [Rosa rugosa]|uniref:mannan endo-1,4-beta-mannosidase 4-like n=1 Tax=Rosa rugosa TaxID=74645 RepID=UPI002B40F573|nr:mannan endo-1,4-beta-mannosidase 4-like [Rosa rugosa]
MPLLRTCILLSSLVFFNIQRGNYCRGETQATSSSFAQTKGNHFVMNGRSFYLNGFNAYWMMYMASDPSTRAKVTSAFKQASKYGMNIARTWAFSDGGSYRPLQSSPGSYNEDMFKGLDFVISEARNYGVHVILSLVNNFDDYGGKKQYVQWAKERGQAINNEDDFYNNTVVKGYYKDHVKTVLTRINSITGVAYRDDSTIFAWELMNEPRCQLDPSGTLLQQWVKEMAAHVKSIDSNHLLEIGLEGFYGGTTPEKKQFNPSNLEYGSDFIANNLIPEIDFASIHIYAEQWLRGASEEAQADFVDKWVGVHIEDCNSVVRKPLIMGEFGKSYKLPGYTIEKRNAYFEKLYDVVYRSASSNRACTGALFWQLLAQGMDNFKDGYDVVLEESPSTASVIAQQSHKLIELTRQDSNVTKST